jgi:hypothetical protein
MIVLYIVSAYCVLSMLVATNVVWATWDIVSEILDMPEMRHTSRFNFWVWIMVNWPVILYKHYMGQL